MITLAKQAIIHKFWLEIRARAEKIKSKEDLIQVVLTVDEFQDIVAMPIISEILEKSRSFGLCLFLAHQDTSQIPSNLLASILQNVDAQFVSKVAGPDAKTFANAWDPNFVTELTNQLATQKKYPWTVRYIHSDSQDLALPAVYWPFYPKNDIQSKEFLDDFIEKQKIKYTVAVRSVNH